MTYRDIKKESLKKAKDIDFAELLNIRMSHISEDHYCAGWLINLEYILWNMIQGGNRNFGTHEVTDGELVDIKRLSDKSGGWWMWKDNKNLELSGEVFVTMDEWLEIYEDYKHE